MDLKHSSNSALFGTCVTTTDTHVILAGGIGTGSHTGYLGQSLVQWPLTAKELSAHSKCLLSLTTGAEWPVMLGSSAVVYRDHLIIVGGGNAGYQSNTLWTEGLYAIKINTNSPVSDLNGIRLMESPRMTTAPEDVDVDVSTNNAIVPLTIIPRMHLNSPEDFRSVLENRKPAILEGLDFGPCLTKWTPQYLCDQVGSDTQVSVIFQAIQGRDTDRRKRSRSMRVSLIVLVLISTRKTSDM
jgi:tRNA wybutosine-synthesizing protein 4